MTLRGSVVFQQKLPCLIHNINVYYLHRRLQTNLVPLYFLFALLLCCVCVCVCVCVSVWVVCGSYSMSEGWNGDDRLDQGKNSNTLQYHMCCALLSGR